MIFLHAKHKAWAKRIREKQIACLNQVGEIIVKVSSGRISMIVFAVLFLNFSSDKSV